jgi:hypothetical protein
MKRALFPILAIILLLAACSKDNTDNTVGWVGTYSNQTNTRSQINRVVISKVDNNTLQLQAQIDSASLIFTVATFQKAIAINNTTMAINENGPITTIVDSTFHFVGSGALSGNSLIFSGSATNMVNATDVKYFYFTGSK